ncbi:MULTISPECIES: UDP-N-acetylmuramate:L-alanyl-gamma-D-glutamyl-meso-diaminopimelate ligase [Methylococcus]|uniref:UDP-N-acetylmuramate--L-alanyl-gamma-D-glutamyl-meso-2,6-diaminoheptandioate ligase n=1 Tax=Methylococcus capsulatus TaxID=414 RepID=A0ABZ2FA45_METCP|nr:UDP-N-acetylmuramate:L-alanyl-gamma-D-glutamyl-meso-diaminopimelate ligase [Methylococcus capsulatus]MDF9392749.1 UDP-N-acetylmuramate:L-alanyl-gamma-D-glutamyl-meso-diaminopimelate ligase [Methylococcus capsulatus]
MRIHILGICGTFMGGLAIMARQLGHTVTGSDQNVYPPMSTLLEQQGIDLCNGYSPDNLHPLPDLVIIGNALSRGNPEVEAVLNMGLAYTSGAQWLYNYVLKGRWVLAVAGTHGKTTTTSMLAWILEHDGQKPGFLIGGVPLNFGVSARIGEGRFVVVEADEYDTAFFDKRSKFVHYRPRTTILNNLEYDHADIFPDLAAIQRQFHHLVRSVPGNGLLVVPERDENLAEVLRMGCWTPVEKTALGPDTAADWQAYPLAEDGSRFDVVFREKRLGTIHWQLSGRHNMLNALSAIAAAHHAGIEPVAAISALSRFQSVKRRLEVRAEIRGITLYDDFAHHPTAIATTLEGLRSRVDGARVIAVVEPRSNTMRMGVHADTLAASLAPADLAVLYQSPDLGWDVAKIAGASNRIITCDSIGAIVERLRQECRAGDHVVFMSNGSFGGIHEKTEAALRED